MATVTVCLHNKYGFCKHGEKCWKQHVEEICKNKACNTNECQKRHPRICRYYSVFKRCKFGEYCAFDHDVPLDPILEEIKVMNDRMKALEKQIIDKNDEIKAVMENLEKALCFMNPRPEVLTTSNNCSVSLPRSLSTQSSITMVNINRPSDSIPTVKSNESNIPQLDGQIISPSIIHQVNCENCGKTFESEEILKTHTDEHEWGCDDCQLCFRNKQSADLHELEYHGDSPDSLAYIHNHIPEETKRLYAAGHRQR